MTVIDDAPGDAVAVTVVTPFVYPVLAAVAVMVPAFPAFTLIVALPSAPVMPVPVAAPAKATVAPVITPPEDWFLTVKFTGVGVPAITMAGLAVTVKTGNALATVIAKFALLISLTVELLVLVIRILYVVPGVEIVLIVHG